MINRTAIAVTLYLLSAALNAQLAPRVIIPAGVYAVNAHGQVKAAAYSIDADRAQVNNEGKFHLLSDSNNISIKALLNDLLIPLGYEKAGIAFWGTGNRRELILKNNSDQAIIINLKKNIELGADGEMNAVAGVENWIFHGTDPDEVQSQVWLMGLQSLLNEGGARLQVNGIADDATLAALNSLVNNKTKWYASDLKNYIGDVTSTATRYTTRYKVLAGLDSAHIENFSDVQEEVNRKLGEGGCYISEIVYDFTINTISLKLNCANEIGYALNITPFTASASSFTGKNRDGTEVIFWME